MMIGEIIKTLRESLNMTQEELAERSGLSRVSIGNYERGSRKPAPEALKKLSKGLNVDYMELMTKAGYVNEEIIESIGKIKNGGLKLKIKTSGRTTIGNILESALRSKKLTLEDLSKKSEIPEPLLKQMLEDKIEPDEFQISKLAETIGFPFMYIYLSTEKGCNNFDYLLTDEFLDMLAVGTNEIEETFQDALESFNIEKAKGKKVNEDKYEELKKINEQIINAKKLDKFFHDKILSSLNSEELLRVDSLIQVVQSKLRSYYEQSKAIDHEFGKLTWDDKKVSDPKEYELLQTLRNNNNKFMKAFEINLSELLEIRADLESGKTIENLTMTLHSLINPKVELEFEIPDLSKIKVPNLNQQKHDSLKNDEHVFTFNVPATRETTVNGRKFLERISLKDAERSFFDVQTLLHLDDKVNFQGIPLTDKDKQLIINTLESIRTQFTNYNQ
ncbi:helix-turn-helix domain-containing protein [Lysinibacillus sp. NPDC092081]|uniref:helix-turn-helix domain-containing protein n=1 Tax=Lysinibacillus sp. NPDC092081 TaxID=3364131 RepID=UPI0038229596